MIVMAAMGKVNLKKLSKLLMSWVIRITPKKNWCYMKGLPSFDDSLVVLYDQLPLGKFDRIIWSIYDESHRPPFEERGETVYVRKGSLKDFWYGIVSKYVFTTHGHFIPNIPPNQTCVNVWHGMPLKAVGLLNGYPGRNDTYVCATSELYQNILARVFGMAKEKVLISGSPRNDLLNVENPQEVWEKAGIDRTKYDKVFLWLPTYRKSVVGDLHLDGVEVDNVFNMVDFPTEKFEAFLKKNKCLCMIKPHPMAPKKEMQSSDHILMIDEAWLWERKLTLYPLVGVTDFLVSDISSIMIDYVLLDRPIIVCFEDAKEYKESRNLLFDPIEDWLPGEIVGDFNGLTRAIESCVKGEDVQQVKREALKKKFHQFTDFKSTQRLLSVLGLK